MDIFETIRKIEYGLDTKKLLLNLLDMIMALYVRQCMASD